MKKKKKKENRMSSDGVWLYILLSKGYFILQDNLKVVGLVFLNPDKLGQQR